MAQAAILYRPSGLFWRCALVTGLLLSGARPSPAAADSETTRVPPPPESDGKTVKPASDGAAPSSPASPPSTPSNAADVADGEPALTPAEREQRAKELFHHGDRRYAEGSYEEAVAAFEQAYHLSARPALLYNIANALERLGRYEQALQRLKQYMPHAPDYQRHTLNKRIRALEARADRRQPTRAGPVAPAPPAPQPTVTERAAPSVAAGQPADSDRQAPPPAPRREAQPIAGYALLGVGGVGIAAGIAFGVAKGNARSEAEDNCVDGPTGALCASAAQDSVRDERRNALLADLSIGAGVVALAIGTVLVVDFVLGEDDQATEVSVRGGPTLGGGRLEIVGRF